MYNVRDGNVSLRSKFKGQCMWGNLNTASVLSSSTYLEGITANPATEIKFCND